MMPQMADAFLGFEDTMAFEIVKKTVVDHEVVESSKVRPVLFFEGVLQPLPARELLIKPEGQRQWQWWALYTDIELALDTVVKDPNGQVYRVKSGTNWGSAGYYLYQLVEGVGV